MDLLDVLGFIADVHWASSHMDGLSTGWPEKNSEPTV